MNQNNPIKRNKRFSKTYIFELCSGSELIFFHILRNKEKLHLFELQFKRNTFKGLFKVKGD